MSWSDAMCAFCKTRNRFFVDPRDTEVLARHAEKNVRESLFCI